MAPEAIPDGALVEWRAGAWLLQLGLLHRWTPAGYADRVPLPGGPLPVLTPPATVAALRAGYRPAVHPSADQG